MRGGSTGALAILLCLGMSACTTTPAADPGPTSFEASTPALACPSGEMTAPPRVADLSFDDLRAQTFSTTLTVPFAGLDSGPLDRPSLVRVSVITDSSNTPVTFTARGGQFIERVTDPWQRADSQITTFSVAGETTCTASAYLLATRVGDVRVTAQGRNTESAVVSVVTNPAAARNVSLTSEVTRVRAGDTVASTASVTDAFGNPIAGVAVVITTPGDGPGRFFNGAQRAVVLTDENGQATTEIVTVSGAGSNLIINARGDLTGCAPLVNQYTCAAGEPVEFFAAANKKDMLTIRVRQPQVRILTPATGTDLSAGQTFNLTAQTAGVKRGVLAQVLWGDEVVALGSVGDGGELRVSDIPARVTAPDRQYQLVVGELPPRPIDLTVRPFNITDFAIDAGGLTFTIATGSWPAGTTIILLRDGRRAAREQVTTATNPLRITVPNRTGFYNVRVRDDGKVISGDQPVLVP